MTVPVCDSLANHDISATTIAIIGAFTHCRSVLRRAVAPQQNITLSGNPQAASTSKSNPKFKNTRAKPTKPLRRLQSDQPSASDHLTASLKQGPADIADVYSRGLRECGRMFVQGDEAARTALATTLAKLNAGLVSVLAALLHARETNDAQTERAKAVKGRRAARGAKATSTSASRIAAPAALSDAEVVTLTLLSGTCRVEVVETLAALRHRMAAKLAPILLPFVPSARCTACGLTGHEARSCVGSSPRPKQDGARKAKQAAKTGKKAATPKPKGATVALVSSEDGKEEKQWAIVRSIPRNDAKQRRQHTRHNSSVSSNSTGTDLSNTSTLVGSATTPPAVSSLTCPTPAAYEYGAANSAKANPWTQPSPRIGDARPSRPSAAAAHIQPQLPTRHPGPPIPPKVPAHDQSPAPQTNPLPPNHESLRPIPRTNPPSNARRGRLAESFYSFHSASTKMGEIPTHKWPREWWDWDEAEQLNRLAKESAGDAGAGTEAAGRASKEGRGMLKRMFARGRLAKG